MSRHWALMGAAVVALGGCQSGPPKKATAVKPSAALTRDVPTPLRDTIGAEASFRGIDPTLVAGLGIVVGLNGTGGADTLDPGVQATMERELARGGIGKGGPGSNYPGLEGVTPQEFLRRKDVAVVIVEARVAPGAPEGAHFDVYVRTLPGSSVTSLEGGQLWTTDLHIGPAAVFGAVKTRKIAEAKGPIFINPFSEPSVNAAGDVQITRTSGRILAGGKVTEPLQIEMVLDNDSFTRARSIQQSINTHFPRGYGDEGPIARGRGNGGGTAGYQSIALRVPAAYKDKPEEFLQLVRHMRVDPALPEEFAHKYVEALKQNPALAEDLRWCLQAIGKPSIPFLKPMYDYPELAPRLAALQAGASLGDAQAALPLIDLARNSPAPMRLEAMRLLADMPANPGINIALYDLVNDPNLEIRVGAYEALRKRVDVRVVRVPVGDEPGQPKFVMDLVAAKDPMVYVTQQGEPRIVLFGGIDPSGGGKGGGGSTGKYGGIRLSKPALVSLWNNQFMLAANDANAPIRIRYQDARSQKVTTIDKAPETLADLIEFLAHRPTPEDPKPGLGLSYSQTVGVVYELSRQSRETGAPTIAATFATEEDRLRAEIYEAMQTSNLADRPENEEDALKQAQTVFKMEKPTPLPSAEPGAASSDGSLRSKVVPLKKATPKKGT